ncbi:hypothetical protein COY95_01600, partial [Candidatus Woesearchaeota archaeon CG_4_10_14_0_8_um_filter_47_5]
MEPLIIILVCLTCSYLMGELFESIKLPRVLGSLIVGLILGLPVVQFFFFEDQNTLSLFGTFAKLGLIFLMFYMGLMIDVLDFEHTTKRSLYISIFSTLLPFLLGFIFLRAIQPSNIVAFIGGVCLAITEETISLEILKEVSLLHTPFGQTILASGALGDIFEALSISVLVTWIHSLQNPSAGFLTILINIGVFFVLIYGARFFIIPAVLKFVGRHHRSKTDLYVISLILALFMALLSEKLTLGKEIGALLAGMIVRYSLI